MNDIFMNHCSRYVLIPERALKADAPKPQTDVPRLQAGVGTYVVQKGDTLNSLAAAYGCTLQDILALNRIPDVYDLRIGQELVMPGK